MSAYRGKCTARSPFSHSTNSVPTSSFSRLSLRACLKNTRGPAAREFGRRRRDEARASPQRALSAESTLAAAKRTAARLVRRLIRQSASRHGGSFSEGGRVFAQKALWLRPAREGFRSCASVTAPLGGCSLVESEQLKSGPL